MDFFSEKNIAKVSFAFAALLITFLVGTVGTWLITDNIHSIETDIARFEKEYIHQQEEKLRDEVHTQLARITSRRDGQNTLLEQRLRNRVEEALAMADNLYTSMQGRVSEQEIRAIIREAIRPMRFNEKQGYIFILTLDGEAILYPANPEIEGKNFGSDEIVGGREALDIVVKFVTTQQQGFVRYDWAQPGEMHNELSQKISYLTVFEPFGWIIGTGEYLNNLEEFNKHLIVNDLRKSLTLDKRGYFFVYDLHTMSGGNGFATMLVNSNRPDLVGRKIDDDIRDINGKEFRKEFLKGIRQSGEAFVTYWYKKTDGSGYGRKLSYFKYYPDWKWVVARGVYLDQFDTKIASERQELAKSSKNDIALLVVIFLIAMIVTLSVAYLLAGRLQRIFDTYRITQERQQGKLARLNKSLEKLSQTDSLTGLYNRLYFNTQLASEIARTNRYGSPVSLIIFDIDWFKNINDSMGHLTGDAILRELAELVRRNIRKNDTLTRWGGEEFTLLVPGISYQNAYVFAENTRLLIAEHKFLDSGTRITCSFGISSYIHAEESEAFVQRADDALYQAKQSGRNCCVGKE